jgi:hypothetical protein
MPYLIFTDFKKQIQTDNLLQVIGSDLNVLNTAQLQAIEEAKSYLVQKYDTSNELRPISQWNPTNYGYKPGESVYLDASGYSATENYAPGVLVLNANIVYRCIAATTGEFDVTKWKKIGNQYEMFVVKYPFAPFDYDANYVTGDKIYYSCSVYQALIGTKPVQGSSIIQYGTYNNVPAKNVAPDSAEGAIRWKLIEQYKVPPYVAVTDTKYFTPGDGRSQQLVAVIIDICLYHLHSRIAPRNIPELRVKRYDDAIAWLRMCANGDITPALPELQPRQGARIRFGGSIKNQNSY